jgi:hypothetical protein
MKTISPLGRMSREDWDSYKVLARLLDTIEFPEVIKIIDRFDDGKYNILPFLTKVQSSSMTINPYNLTRCCRVTNLILPNCMALTDNVLMLLPYLESLTVRSGSGLTSDVFRHLNYLTKLQILSHHADEPDTLLSLDALENLSRLEMLHVRNGDLKDEHFYHLRNLKVLVLDGNMNVTPAILNYLSKIEVCIINKKLYKYISSTKNNAILKKIGKINRVKIYAVENN